MKEVVKLIHQVAEQLGSNAKVARRCGVSEATISLMVNGKWDVITEEMWSKVGSALGYRPDGWQFVSTTNSNIVISTAERAKRESLFVAIAHRAGSGKTASLRAYEDKNRKSQVYYLSCREWSRKEFLMWLAATLGVDTRGSMTVDTLLMEVVNFLLARGASRPLLILDEADKLKSHAFRAIITLYNELEGQIGLLICGTDHLQQQMERDAQYNRKGSDELLSRFGRNFIKLVGATQRDVESVCKANSVSDSDTIRSIWNECGAVKRVVGDRMVEVVEDMRRVRRAIQRELGKASRVTA